MGGRIFLVRHASAASSSATGDKGRELTEEGKARFRRLVESLAEQLPIRRIVASPYARARQTAEILGEVLGVAVEEELSLASGESNGHALLGLARGFGSGCALVGHNPEIGEAMSLAARRGLMVPPGTIAAVDLEVGSVSLAWSREP